MFSGIPDSVKLKNADGTTGRENAGSVICVSFANEDFAVLQQIATQGSQFAFVGDRLKVEAELDASDIQIGAVEIKNGTSDDRVVVKTDGTDFALVVTQNSQPLPTGAATQATLLAARTDIGLILAGMATAANQGTEIASLAAIQASAASIDGKLNSLGQKVMAASVPVVLASDEVVPISAASLPLPTGASTEATLASVLADLDKFTFLAGLLRVDGSGVTQPISAIALPLPTGASTSANQVTANASLTSIDGKLPAALGQQLSAASFGVVIASDQTAIPVTVTSIPLPTGAATAANQVTGNASLSAIDGKLTGVALDASLQSILTDTNKFTFLATRLLTDGSGVTQPVSAVSLPLPTGAATAANQATANGSLASIDGKLPTIGIHTMASSLSIVVASDQTAVPISAASLPLPTGAATSANQATEIASLASIDGKLTTTANGIRVDGSAVTQPVSAASLPLPTGAATEATLTTRATEATLALIKAKTDNLDVALSSRGTEITLSTRASEATLSAMSAKLPAVIGQTVMAGSLSVVVASNQSPFGANGAAVPANSNLIGGRDNAGLLQPATIIKSLGDNVVRTTASIRLAEAERSKLFEAFAEVTLAAGSVEFDAMLIRNPVASGKNMWIGDIVFDLATKAGSVAFRYYKGPTVTAAGAAATISSRRLMTAPPTSAMTVFSSPTISARGTKFRLASTTASSNTYPDDLGFGLVLEPGHDLLITATPDANNRVAVISPTWSEGAP